jgi:hypothetical protein
LKAETAINIINPELKPCRHTKEEKEEKFKEVQIILNLMLDCFKYQAT